MRIRSLLQTMKLFATRNKPQLLTAGGIGLSLAADVFVAKATIKAVRAYDKEAANKGRPLSKKEVVKTCGKYYIWPLGVEVGSATAAIAGLGTSLKRTATALAAVDVAVATIDDMKKVAKENLSEEDYKKLHEKLKDEALEAKSLVVVNDSNTLVFKDALSKRKFRSTVNDIWRFVNELNAEINTSMYVTKNDWFDKIGLEHTSDGDNAGWFQLMEPRFVPALSKDMQEVIIEVDFWDAPVTDFREKAYGRD